MVKFKKHKEDFMKAKQSIFCQITAPVFFFSLLLSLVLAGCQSGSDKEAAQQEGISTDMIDSPDEGDGKTPEFNFEKATHDFGEIKEGEKATHSFKFTNSGQKALVISDANASCGCTVPNFPKKPVKPGESGIIDVAFDSDGKSGKFKKSVTLIANTVPNTQKIHIKGEVTKKQ